VPVTLSGIQVGASLKRLIDFKAQKGFKTGPTISDLQGQVFEKAMNDALLEVLEDIFDNHRELCPPTITNWEMLRQKYQAFQTLCCSSDTRALEIKVAQPGKALEISQEGGWK
jgi:hypothetical protein